MSNPNVKLHERVATIEAKIDHIDEDADDRRKQQQRIEDKLDAMEKDLQRYRGMVGAILLVFTAITTMLKLFWGDLKERFL